MHRKAAILVVSAALLMVMTAGVFAGTFGNTTTGGVDDGTLTRTVDVSGEGNLVDVDVAVTFNTVHGRTAR